MNTKTTLSTLIILFFLPAALCIGEVIYVWKDENGVEHMTNIPPSRSDVEIETMDLKESQIVDGGPVVQRAKQEKKNDEKFTTKVDIIENHVIVPAILTYNNKKVKTKLLLDTGSTAITLHKDVANKLAVKDTEKGSIRVAGGDKIKAEAVTLDSITVGPHTQRNLIAGIIQHTGPDVSYDGLLGMNFLKSYKYSIDFKKKAILWENKGK